MSVKCGGVDDASATGNSEHDWEIFDVLCKEPIDASAGCADHLTHSMDLVTTLRSELAAANYKRDRHLSEVAELRSSLTARDADAENLRAQTVRQSTHITSLQTRLQAIEQRERSGQAQSEAAITQLQRDKRSAADAVKELTARCRRLESDLSTEEQARESLRAQLHDLIRRLCLCLAIDVCDSSHLNGDTVLNKCAEVVAELQRLRTQLSGATESLHNTESELLTVKSSACADKQRQTLQLDATQAMNAELEARARQAERELQCTRDRLADAEVCGNKLREELRGFESRCSRLQTVVDRTQADRLQFLRTMAGQLGVPEPCETLIRERVCEMRDEAQAQQAQLMAARDELGRQRETVDGQQVQLRSGESEKCALGERAEKAESEVRRMRDEHSTLSAFLVRLARSLCWSECAPPDHGHDTAVLSETLLERAERMALYYDHHAHLTGELPPAHHHHHHSSSGHHHPHYPHHHPHPHHHAKLRRERSCHDLPLKETAAVYTLQRRVRVLREQVQRRDLHLELVRRKLALLEDTARGKCAIQTAEREDAVQRARRSGKCAEKTAAQLSEARAQLAEVKAQLSEAIDYKIAALERARKIDELQSKLVEAENERVRLQAAVAAAKSRMRSAADASNERGRRDEQTIMSLRDDQTRMRTQLADTQHKLSQLQAFRTSVARFLHLRDVPHEGILQRLQTLCNAHQEFTLLSRRYEAASPVGEHPCPRYTDDLVPPSAHCRPLSAVSTSGGTPGGLLPSTTHLLHHLHHASDAHGTNNHHHHGHGHHNSHHQHHGQHHHHHQRRGAGYAESTGGGAVLDDPVFDEDYEHYAKKF